MKSERNHTKHRPLMGGLLYKDFDQKGKGEKDDVAYCLLMAGVKIGDEGYHARALYCFEAAEKVAKSEDLMGVILQGLAIAHYNYAILLKEMRRYEEAESTTEKHRKVELKSPMRAYSKAENSNCLH